MNKNKHLQPKEKPNLSKLIIEEGWVHPKTLIDYDKDPFIVLNESLKVITANPAFYKMFKVNESGTIGRLIYKLGNEQWNIPSLKKLLEDIFLKDTDFKGYEVNHDFPEIGRRIMMLNARRVYRKNENFGAYLPMILLGIEDVTLMMDLALKLASHTAIPGVKERAKETPKKSLGVNIGNMEKVLASLNLG